jgi:hypothetical protein
VLTGETSLREGGRLAAGARGGRVVVALHAGAWLDARAGADVTFARLSTVETTMALAKGEARVDAASARDARVTVHASGWTVRAKGGAFVAKVEPDVVRVRVVRGEVGVTDADGREREVQNGDEVELTRQGGDVRVVSHQARDPDAVDPSVLSPDGRAFTLPGLPGRPVVMVAGHGSLPAGTTVVRTSASLGLQARVGAESWALALEPGGAATPAWRKVPRAVGGQEAAMRGVPASRAGAPAIAGGVLGGASTALGPPPPVSRSELDATDPAAVRRLASARLAGWVRACFVTCRREQNCGNTAADVRVRLWTDTDGTVSRARVTSGGSVALRECVERASGRFPVPAVLRGSDFLLEVAPGEGR